VRGSGAQRDMLIGNHQRLRRLFSRNRENKDGTKIFEKSIRQSRTRDEKAQGPHAEERPVGAQGQKPQAGDRDRTFRSEGGRSKDPEETEDCQEAQIEEIAEPVWIYSSWPGLTTLMLSSCLAMACRRTVRLFGRAMRRSVRAGTNPGRRSPALQTLLERVHQVDDVARPFLGLRGLDRLARGFAPDQRLQRALILVLEFARVEMRGLGVEDVARKLDHVL
jgi:hypothetical protein